VRKEVAAAVDPADQPQAPQRLLETMIERAPDDSLVPEQALDIL
jgi:hypothetical protein